MDITINIDELDKTQAVVNSASDRTPVSDFELLVVGNRIPLTIRFCDDDGATPAFVTDGTVSVDIGLGLADVDGNLDYASYAGLTVDGSTRVGTLDLSAAVLRNAVYSGVTSSANNQRLAQAPFLLEVRTTTAAGIVQTRCLQRVFVGFRVMPLTLDTNPDPGNSGRVPSGGTAGYVLTKLTGTDYDYAWLAASAASLPSQTGHAGEFLTTDGTNASWAPVSGTGSVTSVAMTVPSILSVSGSPITTSGTLAVTLATQSANLVFAGPTTGSAATPTFRSLVANDIPSLTLSKISDAGTLAALNAAPAGTLTGTTLATNVVTSSLTALGTIATGVWQGTAVADSYIASAATWNAKQAAITFGTGVLTALGVNIGSAGAPVLFNGALGTPSSGTLTNCTFPTLNQNTTGSAASLSISGQTGLLAVTGLASTNRVKTVRDAADTILELGGSYTPTGTWTNMVMVTPNLGTPSALVVTNATGTASININGTVGATTPNTVVATSITASVVIKAQLGAAAGLALYLGADTSGSTITNNTAKGGWLVGPHYDNTEEPVGVIKISSTSGGNSIAIGGGDSSVNTTGNIYFYTAANGTTTTGTNNVSIEHTKFTTLIPIELGHASDTTISRVSAGVVAIEGKPIVTTSSIVPYSTYQYFGAF